MLKQLQQQERYMDLHCYAHAYSDSATHRHVQQCSVNTATNANYSTYDLRHVLCTVLKQCDLHIDSTVAITCEYT